MFVTATRWDRPDSIDRQETSPEARDIIIYVHKLRASSLPYPPLPSKQNQGRNAANTFHGETINLPLIGH